MNKELYYITEAEDDMGLALVLKASWSDEFINIIRKENISVLRLSYSAGWKEKDLSFLEKLTDIGLRGAEVYAWDVKDIIPLQFIPRLKSFGLQCEFTKAPDFSSFNQLKICKLFWRSKAETIFGCLGLELLNIVNYPAEDLQKLKYMIGLKRLQLMSRKLMSLAGIESLQSLEILDLAHCYKLESLKGIEECQEIHIVELENCKKIDDISSLGKLIYLRHVVLTDCGKVKSLQPLANCRLLESLTFTGDTAIEDGELTPLLDLPELKRIWFADRHHYSHTREQMKSMLS